MIMPNVSIVTATIFISGLNNEKVKVKKLLPEKHHSIACVAVHSRNVCRNARCSINRSFFTFSLFKPLMKIVALTIETFGVIIFLFGE